MSPLTDLRALGAVVALGMCITASAQSTFRISEVFSNLDGTIQFVRLTETAGLDGQQHFTGLALNVTNGGVSHRFAFDADLATDKTAHLSIVVAATPTHAIDDVTRNGIEQAFPDFIVPARFLPAGGGTLDFAGIDTVSYPTLPGDGVTAWYRDETFAPATLPGGCRQNPSSSCPGLLDATPTLGEAVEYYNAALDHYFLTASADEIEALDSAPNAAWQRTGESLSIAENPRTPIDLEYVYYAGPVCRFYLPPGAGDSHFFSASADECAAVRTRFPTFVQESAAAFYVAEPNLVTGDCGGASSVDGDWPFVPVYRVWNGRADGNHRYTTSVAIRDAMIARGWVAEGHGPLGVVMCLSSMR